MQIGAPVFVAAMVSAAASPDKPYVSCLYTAGFVSIWRQAENLTFNLPLHSFLLYLRELYVIKTIMKKFLLLASACMLSLSACESGNSNEGDDNGGGSTPPAFTEGVTAEAYYAGAYDENAELGSYWINFYPDDNEMDDFGELLNESGYIFCISFSAPLSENPDRAVLPDGSYAGSEDIADMTFRINDENESYVIRLIDGSTVQTAVTGGTVDIDVTDGIYRIECALTLDGDEEYTYSYTGEIIFHNRSQEGMYSTLNEDVAISGLSQGYVELFGESMFEGAESDMARIVLGDDDFDILTLLGKGHGVVIDFNIPVGSESIPDGRYEILPSDASSIPAGTLVPGMISYSMFFGCWYFSGMNEAALCDGTVDISHSGSNYEISFSLKDGYGHTVSGSYSGELYE